MVVLGKTGSGGGAAPVERVTSSNSGSGDCPAPVRQGMVTEPSKLSTHPDSEGHIAIILPSKGLYEEVKSSLATEIQQ